MNTENYKVGIYLRLSREDERLGESSSISNQRDLLLNYIRDNNLLFISEYVDDGVSGTTFDRAGFNQMIKDCEDKKINMIITKDTSRLGRDHIEFGYYVERYFPEHNIRYVAVNDGIDTASNNSANDMLVFKSAFNDMYVKDISNKLRSSLYTKKRNGQFVGAYAPYGYIKDPNDKHKLIIDEESANIVKRIFNMFASGKSLNIICDTLTNEKVPTPSMQKNMNLGHTNLHYGVWSTRTVDDILKNECYIGNLVQCKQKKINYKSKKRIRNKKNDYIIATNAIPPIITKETFNLVQEMFKSNKYRGTGDGITSKLLLRGLIYCRECGHTIGFKVQKQNTKKYGEVTRVYGNCNYWAKRRKLNVCTPHTIKYSILEEIVLSNLTQICKTYLNEQELSTYIKNNKQKTSDKEKYKNEIIKLNQNINQINKKIDACYNDRLEGNITLDMYKRTYNNLILELEKLESSKEKLEELLKNKPTNDNDKIYDAIIKDFISMKNPTRSIIASLIDKIEIDENKCVNIYYKFKI